MKAPVVVPDDPPEEPPDVPPDDDPPLDPPLDPPDEDPPEDEPTPDEVVPSTVNGEPVVYEPPALVIVTGPVVAPGGMIAVTPQSELTTSEVAATPLNVTFDAVVRLVPWMLTEVPTGP